MGFFSKLKKAWGSSDDVVQQALDEYKQEQGIEPEESAPEPIPVSDTPAPEKADVETDAAPTAHEEWQQGLTLSLRQAEPKLSEWLNLIVEGVDEKGPSLWERLAFLFKALGAPKDETREFISKFETWLDDMGYVAVAEFKSELQYRLALALELEDEEDERDRLFLKLSEGISKTREQITKRIDGLLSAHSSLDDDFWEEFEEILIMADVGMEAASQLMENLKARARKAGTDNPDDFKDILRDELEEIFKVPPRIEAVNPTRGADDGRRQRRGQDHHHRQARLPRPDAGPQGSHRGGRHLPRRGHRPAQGLGRSPGRGLLRQGRGLGSGGRGLRGHGQGQERGI